MGAAEGVSNKKLLTKTVWQYTKLKHPSRFTSHLTAVSSTVILRTLLASEKGSSMLLSVSLIRDFPGGTTVENPPANAGDARDAGSVPGLGRLTGGGNGNPLQYSCLGSPVDRGAWRAPVHGVTESWMRLNTHVHTALTRDRSSNSHMYTRLYRHHTSPSQGIFLYKNSVIFQPHSELRKAIQEKPTNASRPSTWSVSRAPSSVVQ